MNSGFRNIKEEARAKTRAMYEATNPVTCLTCGRRFPTVKSLNEHHYSHIWDHSSAIKYLGQSSSPVPPAAYTPVLPTPLFVGKSVYQPAEVNPEKSIWKPLHVSGEDGDGYEVGVDPVGVELQSTKLKAPAEGTGVDTGDEVKEMELDLSLHL